jgi:hypothetical protein
MVWTNGLYKFVAYNDLATPNIWKDKELNSDKQPKMIVH